ncbi:alpha/beta hydrolase [Conexibacter sp. CPCC 206217]|uniref:alpha/beta hydrolase n=1 Tax=Conexibacter sp. CPCC 206217 TaxID=3064574 RepID=UPI00271CA87A|nr:alpha/beta hydrolase [Conexibacter sp. CPCC 206217]MDO8208936.1 alpha/beta hydrolase [Conexibacter sp. CPCC 206217]
MTLEPQAAAFLRRLADAGAPPQHTLTPAQARSAHDDAAATVSILGEPVAEVRDVVVSGPGGEIPVRLYAPQQRERRGALVYIHGGGFVVGSLDSFDGLCRALANRAGTTVVSVDYRRAPEHRFPAALDDCLAVTGWAAAGGAEPLAEGGSVVVAGDSAGGNLAALVAIAARDRGGPPLAGQALLYPMTDATMSMPSMRELAEGYSLTAADVAWFWEHYLGETDGSAPAPGASPLHVEDLAGLPPALVVTAGYDPLRDEGDAYALRLSDAGNAVGRRRFDGMIHGFARMTALFDSAVVALDEVAAFVRGLPDADPGAAEQRPALRG